MKLNVFRTNDLLTGGIVPRIWKDLVHTRPGQKHRHWQYYQYIPVWLYKVLDRKLLPLSNTISQHYIQAQESSDWEIKLTYTRMHPPAHLHIRTCT
jgi:hypothetical protein